MAHLREEGTQDQEKEEDLEVEEDLEGDTAQEASLLVQDEILL